MVSDGVRLRNNFIFLKMFKEIFEKNKIDSPNNYSKEKLCEIISFAFGVTDPRSVEAKLKFALLSKIIIPRQTGYSINPNITETYEQFVQNNYVRLVKLDLMSGLNG